MEWKQRLVEPHPLETTVSDTVWKAKSELRKCVKRTHELYVLSFILAASKM
jgi:hypothetical protein